MASLKKAYSTKPRNNLTAAYVRSILRYNPKTGKLYWRVNRRPRGRKNKIAGWKNDLGYIQIGIDGKMYLGHRLAHLIILGKWPPDIIDHKFGKPWNNQWNRIRPATYSQNSSNRGPAKNNKCGKKGVYKHTYGKWCAMIQSRKKAVYLGLFTTRKKAVAAYNIAAKKLHGKFARLS